MNFSLQDPTTQLWLAAAGGAAAGAVLAALIARFAANLRIRKVARMQSAAVQRALEQERARLEPPKPQSAGGGGTALAPAKGTDAAALQHTEFGEHQDAWDRLADLRLSMDRLWARAAQRNADEFSRHLEAVRKWAYEKDVPLEDQHSEELRRLVLQLEAFRDNKQGLHDLMRQRPVDEAAVFSLTDRYAEVRRQYNELVESLRGVFKKKTS